MGGSRSSDDKGGTRMKERGAETLDMDSGASGGIGRGVVMAVNIATVRKHGQPPEWYGSGRRERDSD